MKSLITSRSVLSNKQVKYLPDSSTTLTYCTSCKLFVPFLHVTLMSKDLNRFPIPSSTALNR